MNHFVITLKEFNSFLTSKSRLRTIYASGFLMLDNPKHKIAKLALKAQEDGLVFLTQKKIRDGHYLYWATKRKGK